jgi:outer membrane receptor protein involved in Fe transport
VTPARFSGAPIGGAINVVTKKPTSFSGSVSAGKRALGGEQYGASLNFPLLGGHMLIGLGKDRSLGNFKYKDYAIQSYDRLAFGDGTNCYSQGSPCGEPYDLLAGRRRIPVDRKRQSNSSVKENALFKWENRNFVAKFAQTDLNRMMPERILSAAGSYQRHFQDLPWRTPSTFNPERRQALKKREALVG